MVAEAEAEVVVASMSCSLSLVVPGGGVLVVACSGTGGNAGGIGRERNRAARAAKMFSSGQKKVRRRSRPRRVFPAVRQPPLATLCQCTAPLPTVAAYP